MAAIMTTCPTTATSVKTGQHATKAEFADAPADLAGTFRCGACGRVHDWTKAQAWLVEWPGATSTLG